MEQNNKKTITVCFAIAAALITYVFIAVVDLLSAVSGTIARLTQGDFVQHVLPVLVGFGVFLVFQLTPSIKAWGDEVVTEIRKVVWRSVKETGQLTIVVCILLVIVGIFLSVVDLGATKVVNYLLTL